MEKKEIRKHVRELRRALTGAELSEKSRKICDQVLRLPVFAKADELFTYMDCKGEVCTKALIEAAWQAGKRVAAPKVAAGGAKEAEMSYFYIHSFEDAAPGYCGIPEPLTGEPADQAEEASLEGRRVLLLVPGVGFDVNRNRCGYGQGFYDRYLAAHRGFRTAALAFDFQIVDEVPARAEDIRPEILVTESGIYA